MRLAVGMAQFSVGAEGLHEALHGAQIVEGPETGRFVPSRAMETAEIVRKQFLALRIAERDVGIEEQRSEIVLRQTGPQPLEVDQAHLAIPHDDILALEVAV